MAAACQGQAPPGLHYYLLSDGHSATPQPLPPAKGRTYGYVIAILLLPALVLARRDDVLFTPMGWSDPWFYFGYARNLVEFKRYLFRELYYGTRLAWLLPADAAYSLFSPVTAACVLHLLVWAAAALAFFFALRSIAGSRSAFLTTALLGMHPWLWACTGWDYPDGAAVAYAMAATALYVRAARQPSRWVWLLMAGVAAGATIHCNLFWAVIAPVLPLTYVGLAYAWQQRSPIRSALESALWGVLGAALLTAALGGVNYWLDGNFNLFGPSLRQGRGLVSRSSVWTTGLWGAHGLQPWLWFAVAGVLVSAILLPGRFRRCFRRANAPALAFSLQLCLVVAALCWWQGTPALGLVCIYYTSALVPFIFLVVGTSFWKSIDDLGTRSYLSICAAAVAAFGFVWYGGETACLPAAVAAALAAVALACALFTRRALAAALLAIAGFGILTVEVRQPVVFAAGTARRSFERITRTRARLESVRHGRRIHFWFDERDPENLDLAALTSTYLADWSFLGTAFPQPACGPFAAPDTGVVALSSREGAPELARRALADCWRKDGLLARVEDSFVVEGVARPYTVTAIFADPDPSVRRPLRAVFDTAGAGSLAPLGDPREAAFPLGRWHVEPRTEASFSPAAVRVRTARDAYSFGLLYPPLVAPLTARYSFTLKFTPGSGEFAFGLSAPGAYNWMAVSTSGNLFQPPRQIVVYADLKQGEAFQLAIANNSNYGPSAASFAIHEVSATVLDPSYGRNSSTPSTTRAWSSSSNPL